MAWDFSTDPDFQAQLDWIDGFVRDEVEPLDLAFSGQAYRTPTPALKALLDPLKQQVRDRTLWACHLGPDLGGQGYGQLKLGLMNEILGRSSWAPIVFGTQAPDTGNAEIIAHYGTEEQKERYLKPLLDGELFSCYSMTEPHGGSDPTQFTTRAERDGDEWVITGEKFFSSNARTASFLIVMAVTDPDISPYKGMSMFLVPTDSPGIEFVRDIGLWGERLDHEGGHAWIRYNQVRVPLDGLLGGEGQAFVIAQTRLGGGRIHHAMRTVGRAKQALDMMCERALSRHTQGEPLAKKQLVQQAIADSWSDILQLRLMVLYTAWLIDQKTTAGVRREIAACKVLAARVLHDVGWRAMHLHGALGVSNEMPLAGLVTEAAVMATVDGPTEVHQVTLARQVLKEYKPSDGLMPSAWLPPRIEAARARFAAALEHHVANL